MNVNTIISDLSEFSADVWFDNELKLRIRTILWEQKSYMNFFEDYDYLIVYDADTHKDWAEYREKHYSTEDITELECFFNYLIEKCGYTELSAFNLLMTECEKFAYPPLRFATPQKYFDTLQEIFPNAKVSVIFPTLTGDLLEYLKIKLFPNTQLSDSEITQLWDFSKDKVDLEDIIELFSVINNAKSYDDAVQLVSNYIITDQENTLNF